MFNYSFKGQNQHLTRLQSTHTYFLKYAKYDLDFWTCFNFTKSLTNFHSFRENRIPMWSIKNCNCSSFYWQETQTPICTVYKNTYKLIIRHWQPEAAWKVWKYIKSCSPERWPQNNQSPYWPLHLLVVLSRIAFADWILPYLETSTERLPSKNKYMTGDGIFTTP